MKVTIPGFIYAKGTSHYDYKTMKRVDGPEFQFFHCDSMAGGEYGQDRVLIGPHEIVAEIPDSFDPRQQLAENLKAEKKRLMAEFNRRVTEIDRQIQKYLAIEA